MVEKKDRSKNVKDKAKNDQRVRQWGAVKMDGIIKSSGSLNKHW